MEKSISEVLRRRSSFEFEKLFRERGPVFRDTANPKIDYSVFLK